MVLCCAQGAAVAADTIAMDAGESRYTSEGTWIPAVTDKRDSAAVFAIGGAIQVNAMTEHCSAIDPLLAVKANEARNRWMRHNGELVKAAHGYVRLQRAIVQVKQGESAGTQYHDKVMLDARSGAIATLRDWFPNEVRDAAKCDQVVGEYLAGARDIDADANYGSTLGGLAGDMQAFADKQRSAQ
jgi:hypothetical protein